MDTVIKVITRVSAINRGTMTMGEGVVDARRAMVTQIPSREVVKRIPQWK